MKWYNLIFKSIVTAFVLTILFTFCGFKGQCEDIEQKVLRLHILANSDSVSDQNLKLDVRDEIVLYVANLLEDSSSKSETVEIINNNLENIKQVAKNEIKSQGYNYSVNVVVTNMLFDTRVYDNITMPSGWYDAVRVTIGSGQGHNWWCVLFPSICLSVSAEQKDEQLEQNATNTSSQKIEEVLDEDETKIVTEEESYHFSFKIVEFFEWAWSGLFG